MVDVRVLVISNKPILGPEPLFPQTIETAVASPRALPTPKIIPEKIPDLALVKTTLKFVCVLEAPRANDPKINELLTLLIDVTEIIVIVGRIIIAKTKTVESKDIPPAVWIPNIVPKLATIFVIIPAPNKP